MDGSQQVADHLKTLSICHYVYAGLAACGSCFGAFYIALGGFVGEAIRNAPERGTGNAPPPEIANLFTGMFAVIGGVIMLMALTVSVLCFLSGRAMSQRRNHTLSLVVAALVCLTGLFGIALGVFTFIVLLKPETKALYEEAERGTVTDPS